MSATDVLGWVGAVGVLVAYGLLTLGRWQSSTLPYQATNAICAGALLVWAISIRGWQSALLNAVWMLVGRPVIWGLSTYGAAGVQHVVEMLAAELAMAMSLLGAPTVGDLTRDLLLRV